MIGIVDYKAGNLTSVARALHYLGVPCEVTDNPEILDSCDRIIFPGVGAAGEAMINLRSKGLDRRLREWVASGKPTLGICLGTQVIFERSEENDTVCLGIVPGSVQRFPGNLKDREGRFLKIPHMGWNQIEFPRAHPVFKDLPAGAEFYFVHSYYPAPADERWAIGWTDYGLRFCAAIAHENLVAVQFHPEKSGAPGLQILANFCRWGGQDAQ
ncbi:MAG: imidazole glycerol phosphate synthase subunit HisH [Syntrophales bacterium]|jgi:glutamine amidotransferase|nr:imidazole glycerol phosphate synthase subunit HisH [Syntrophales bacterium]